MAHGREHAVSDVQDRIKAILADVRRLAIEYHDVTGKPLGATGEIGEYEASVHLGLRVGNARSPGYDAVDLRGRRYQIKARCVPGGRPLHSQRIGSIRFTHEWDAVLLVLMTDRYETMEIWEADREALREALERPGSRARNERGALHVGLFRRIGRRVWPRDVAGGAA